MDESQAIPVFEALTDGTRLAILRFLVSRGPDGASAGEIGSAVGARSSRAAFHLSKLKGAELVRAERVSRQTIYRVDFGRLGDLIRFLIDDCCSGSSTLKNCCNDPVRGSEVTGE